MSDILRVDGLSKAFIYQKNGFKKVKINAVQQVSFSLEKGKTLAIMGKNGSGKSTLSKLLVGLLNADEGRIFIDDQEFTSLPLKKNKAIYDNLRKRSQLIRMVFPLSETQFNPIQTIKQCLEVPLKFHTNFSKMQRLDLIIKTLNRVGLSEAYLEFFPMSMAPGFRQRVALARALVVNPKVLIFDESFSSLDISSYSQIINLMLELQQKQALSYIYISHNLGVISHVSDDVIVMSEGKVIESGKTQTVIQTPQNEITQRLIKNFFD